MIESRADSLSPMDKLRELGNSVRRSVRNQSSVQFSRLLTSRRSEPMNDDSYLEDDDLLSVEFQAPDVRHCYLIYGFHFPDQAPQSSGAPLALYAVLIASC